MKKLTHDIKIHRSLIGIAQITVPTFANPSEIICCALARSQVQTHKSQFIPLYIYLNGHIYKTNPTMWLQKSVNSIITFVVETTLILFYEKYLSINFIGSSIMFYFSSVILMNICPRKHYLVFVVSLWTKQWIALIFFL